MKIVIIEDEQLTAEDLADILMNLPADIMVVKILCSVAEAVEYFRENSAPDLIFCDIELGDGYSFEIFSKVDIDVPVIFCTAFNKYALEAFKNNGIDYILKPFTRKTIREAINKFNHLKLKFASTAIDFDKLLSSNQRTEPPAATVSSLLVNFKDKIIPIKLADIALFTIDFKSAQLITFANKKYLVNHTMEELEAICGNAFYRASRQHLVNKSAIQEALQYSTRKLFLKLSIEGEFDITVSKLKVPEFLSWLRS
jgi:DNA-binding LytR/AlgR family response regulator